MKREDKYLIKNIGTKQNDKGKEYFIHNKTRIIITEHFNENGKCFMELVGNAIERNAAMDSHTIIKDKKYRR